MPVIHRVIRAIGLPVLAAGLLMLGCGYAATIFLGAGAVADGGGGGGGKNNAARFTVSSSVDLTGAVLAGSSPNLTGPPQITSVGPNVYQVTVGLNQVPDGESVHLTLAVQSPTVPDGDLQVKRIVFYSVPPSQLPPTDPPAIPESVSFVWRLDSQLGTVLEATNPASVPASLVLEGATSSVVFSGTEIYYEGLPGVQWAPLANTTIAPQQTVLIDLPDHVVEPPTPAALLLRYITTVSSIAQKGACQLELSGPIHTEVSTWGRVKALYR